MMTLYKQYCYIPTAPLPSDRVTVYRSQGATPITGIANIYDYIEVISLVLCNGSENSKLNNY